MQLKHLLLIFGFTIILPNAEPETVYRSGYFKRDASRSYSYKRDADAEPFGAFKRDAGAEPEAWGRW
ncbi:uncharacterized protein OCT59_015532 [Rhizophagus irregularis]|uniref:Uncharacterized protein n=1 Tax=Rhizophagus irregularis (strain DAOM 181602 / DAOM 197198 / MUCL 43194) TaxID=747089 RepID=A0A2P4QDF5_RHIID|nr:hypothetical protein GLOIN_2v1769891 [Rhizophagus irregularis DAOM 181602=DAOM 197198]POG75663.1 hypothetical protein GLOIN_2v1769891 [Rhizophagus irregularis DAOM 181602=DAOM 197198]UZO23188.1 hypothetical protein OCT59_015532 [Rhizophagus irregularis]|eukprot:XP_025182529.1 hypothetical protein GLOIN_2v1769891 [Rhizophagus irregularis DAOM 181602=DAOM 197198]